MLFLLFEVLFPRFPFAVFLLVTLADSKCSFLSFLITSLCLISFITLNTIRDCLVHLLHLPLEWGCQEGRNHARLISWHKPVLDKCMLNQCE